jgi:hypothetical protein
MAKQQMIKGTVDEAPAEVQEAADAYVKAKRATSRNREKMNGALEALVIVMKEHDVAECLIDDGDKRLILSEKDQVKIKVLKRAPDGDGDEDDEE